MIDNIGGRKILAAIVVMALAVGAVLLKGDVPPNFLQLLQVVFGAFVLGNGIEHVAGAVGARGEVDLSPVNSQLEQLKAEVLATQSGVATTQQSLSALIQRVIGG